MAAVFALIGVSTARAQAPLSLEAFVDQVVDHGVAGRAAALDVEIARAEAVGAGLWSNPRLELSRQQANVVGVRAGETQDQVLVSLPLPLSGRAALERESAERGIDAATARLAHARGRLRHEATDVFFDVIAARARMAAQRQAIDALTAVADAIRARALAGDAAGYENVRVELELGRAQSALASAEDDEHEAIALARALWPADLGALVIGERALAEELAIGRAADIDVATRGDVRALAASGASARTAADAASRAWIPEPAVSVGGYVLDVVEPERGAGYFLAVELALPAFDRGQGDHARATARAAQADAQRALVVQRATEQLTAARAAVDARRTRAKVFDNDVLARARALAVTTVRAYRAGGLELLAVVDAARAKGEAEVAAIELARAAREAENDLLLISGAYDDAPASSARSAP